jgi:hypothetical protein
MKAWLRAGWVLGALLCACNEQQPPAQPGSFDRPTRVGFACFNLEKADAPEVLALDKCDRSHKDIWQDGKQYALHALVVQSSRGEVAAVDLLNNRTLDSRRDIPGYTFLPVGELPAAIAVPKTAEHAKFTYVANAGSRDITVLETLAFRELGAKQNPTRQTLPLPGGNLDAPYDMVLAPDEDALFVSMPQTGRLLRVAIQRCDGAPDTCNDGELDANGITEIPLRDSVARSGMDQSPDVPAEQYAKTCGYAGQISNASLPLPELPADAAMTQPQPSGLAVDNFCMTDRPCTTRLLVADQALPLIHVVDFAAAAAGREAVQIPIRTGVPTTTVAVTPRVPVDLSEEPAETQYVYAIDATDGSVLVTENGRLLQVGPEGTRPDRISLGTSATLPVAISLSVMTPAFDVHGPANQYAQVPTREQDAVDGNFCTDTSHTTRSNLRLRGVFLSVGTADGTIRVIDVHDMDLAHCRNCDRSAENWDPYPVVRHRTRIAYTAAADQDPPPLAPTAQPAFATGTSVVPVLASNGSTSDPVIDGLGCVACGEAQVPAFPPEDVAGELPDAGTPADGGDSDAEMPEDTSCARVCVQNDAWADTLDWVAVFEGVIPGSRAGDAHVEASEGGYELQQTEARFCEHGVLGEDALTPNPGDRLNVVGPLPSDDAIRAAEPHRGGDTFENDVVAACKRLVSARDNTDTPEPIAFPIRAAYDDRLVLSPDLVTRPMQVPRSFESDMQFVKKCFGGRPLSYEIRAGSGWLVLSPNDSRFSHRVRAEESTKHCVEDQALDRRFNARAYSNESFDNGSVAFRIVDEGQPPKRNTTFLVGLKSTTQKTVLNATITVNTSVVAAIPVDLRWSDQDDALYMVDVASRGLVQILMDPFPIGGATRSFQ